MALFCRRTEVLVASKKYVGRFRPQRNKWAHQRTKLDRAGSIARMMEKAYYAMWPGCWPSAHCLNTCLVLVPILRSSLEWNVTIAVGRIYGDNPHAWIFSPEKDILNPTFGMFDFGPALRILPARQNWVLGHWPELELTLNQEKRLLAGFRPLSNVQVWTAEIWGCCLNEGSSFPEPAAAKLAGFSYGPVTV